MKCQHCPCRDLPYSCPSYTAPHPVYCDLARESPEYREIITRTAVEDALPEDYTPPTIQVADTSRSSSVLFLAGKVPSLGKAAAMLTLAKSLYDTHAHAIGFAIVAAYEDESMSGEDRASLEFLSSAIRVVYGEEPSANLAGEADAVIIVDDGDVSKAFLDSHTNNPVVFVLRDHCPDPSEPSPGRENSRIADIHVASTHTAAAFMPRINRSGVGVIPHGVDQSRCSVVDKDFARMSLGLPDKNIVGYIGSVSPNANLETLIDAAAILPERFRVLICGYGEPSYLDSLQQRADANAPGKVGFLPWSYDISLYMSSIDVLIRPASRGGFGASVAEAWLCEKPVISTDIGVASDQKRLVKIMPKTNSGEIMARYILDDDADPSRPRRVAAAAETAANEYIIGKTGGTWSDLIKTLVEAKRQPYAPVQTRLPRRQSREAYLANKEAERCHWRSSLPECACRNKFSCALGKGSVKPGVVMIEECIACKSSEIASKPFILAETFPDNPSLAAVIVDDAFEPTSFTKSLGGNWCSNTLSFDGIFYKSGDSVTNGISSSSRFSDVMVYYETEPSRSILDNQPSHIISILVVDDPSKAAARADEAFWADLIVATNHDAASRVESATPVAIIHGGVESTASEPLPLDFPEGSVVVSSCDEESARALVDVIECGDPSLVGLASGLHVGCIDTVRMIQERVGDRIRIVAGADHTSAIISSHVHLSVRVGRGFDPAVASAWMNSIPVVATAGGIVDPAYDIASIVPDDWTAEGVAATILAAVEETQGNRLRLLRAKKYAGDQMTPRRCARRWAETIEKLIRSGRSNQPT